MEDLQKTLLELTKKAWDANIQEDVGFYRNYMIDDAVGITGYGIVDKPTLLKQLENHSGVPFTNYTIEDPRVISLTPESAILIYKITIEAVRSGQKIILTDYASSVFVKRNGEWKGAMQQHSRIPATQQQ